MTLNTFLAFALKTWIFASNVLVPHSIVVETPGAWTEVLVSNSHCMMYRAALKSSNHGEIAVFHRRPESSCLESISNHILASVIVTETPKINANEQRIEIELKNAEEQAKSTINFWGIKNSERNAHIGDNLAAQPKFLNPQAYCDSDCRLCPRGWMQVTTIDGVKKICHNPNECGGRAQPACYLGQDWGGKRRSGCKEGSLAGWCQADLTLTCSSVTNYLVCE